MISHSGTENGPHSYWGSSREYWTMQETVIQWHQMKERKQFSC